MSRALRPIDLLTTLERVNVPSALVDRNGIVTWQNRAARETVGDLVGKPFASIVAPEDQALARRQLERLLSGVPVADYDIDLFSADGRRHRAEISSVTVEHGDPYQAVFGIAVVGPPQLATAPKLTKRQREVLELLGEGASTDQMAATLHLSKETIRNYVRQVLHALGAHSRLEAVALAHQDGLLSATDGVSASREEARGS
jgi:PAS domain S-box-containing protein